jgi:Chemotaxis phosphatase CheX
VSVRPDRPWIDPVAAQPPIGASRSILIAIGRIPEGAVTDLLASDRLARSVSRVTATMLGLTFRAVVPATQIDLWRTAVLPIPGARPITVALSSDRHGCAALTAAVLGLDQDDLGLEMIDDFMRELLNMAAGQIKLELRLNQSLGLPRVTDGDALFASPEGWSHHLLDSQAMDLPTDLPIHLVVSLRAGVM